MGRCTSLHLIIIIIIIPWFLFDLGIGSCCCMGLITGIWLSVVLWVGCIVESIVMVDIGLAVLQGLLGGEHEGSPGWPGRACQPIPIPPPQPGSLPQHQGSPRHQAPPWGWVRDEAKGGGGPVGGQGCEELDPTLLKSPWGRGWWLWELTWSPRLRAGVVGLGVGRGSRGLIVSPGAWHLLLHSQLGLHSTLISSCFTFSEESNDRFSLTLFEIIPFFRQCFQH